MLVTKFDEYDIPEYNALFFNTHKIDVNEHSGIRRFSAVVSASVVDAEGDVMLQHNLYDVIKNTERIPLSLMHTDTVVGHWESFTDYVFMTDSGPVSAIIGNAVIDDDDEIGIATQVWNDLKKGKYEGVSISAEYMPALRLDDNDVPYRVGAATKIWAISLVEEPSVKIARIIARTAAKSAPNVCNLCDKTAFECIGNIQDTIYTSADININMEPNPTTEQKIAGLTDMINKFSAESESNRNNQDKLTQAVGSLAQIVQKMDDKIKKTGEENDKKTETTTEKDKEAEAEKKKEMDDMKKDADEAKKAIKSLNDSLSTMNESIDKIVNEKVAEAVAKAKDSNTLLDPTNVPQDMDPDQELILTDGMVPPPQVQVMRKLASKYGTETAIAKYHELMNSGHFMQFVPITNEQELELNKSLAVVTR